MSPAPWFSANGRDYSRPARPVAVVCLDGCDPEYLDAAFAAGRMPALQGIIRKGALRIADSAMPSFTNPNNLSMATGRPSAVHGICGNYFLDPKTGREVMMNDERFLRAPTLFAEAQRAGARIAVATAKDKLRRLLGAGLQTGPDKGICLSAERSASSTSGEHGIANAAEWLGRPQPEVYSADLSEFVLAAGVKLLEEFRPDIMYLTTTDYVQHKFAPGAPEALEFQAMADRYLGQLDAAGAALVVTADHGMKAKHDGQGRPNVIYAQTLADRWFGEGAARVILPITDPYVVHHGALGSWAVVHLPDSGEAGDVMRRFAEIDGVDAALSGDDAQARFALPRDRIGDIVLLAGENHVIGTAPDRHDLGALDAPLRSHGGLSERKVPFIVNRAVEIAEDVPLSNYDAFPVAFRAAGTKEEDDGS